MLVDNIASFVKQAGGKRQLLNRISERMSKSFNNYFETFIGSGDVLFELQPQKAVINDINSALTNAYKIIYDKPQDFIREIKKLDSEMREDGKQYYMTN